MTRTRIHLACDIPSEGARRLAWWLGHQRGNDAIERFAERIHRHVSFIDRLLSGEFVPGGEVAHFVWLATDGAVLRTDWRTPPAGGWFDEPVKRTLEQIRLAA